MKVEHRSRPLVWLALSLVTAACSGGSGGGGVPTAPTAITPANATEVARSASTTMELIDFEELLGFQTLTGSGEGVTACPSGGTVTAAFEVDAVPVGVVSTGDRFSVSFDDCLLSGSSSLNGGITIDFDLVMGNYLVDDTWQVDLDFTIDDLTFASGPASGSFDGGWSQSTSYDMGDVDVSFAGGFTTTVDDGSEVVIAALSGLVLSGSYDATAMESTYSVDGTFASTELGGSVTIETLQPLVVADGDEYPGSGVLRASGSGGSTLTLTVLDATSVQLDVDADGDGTPETQLITTWLALEA